MPDQITPTDISKHQQIASLIAKGLAEDNLTMVACLQALQTGYTLGLAQGQKAG